MRLAVVTSDDRPRPHLAAPAGADVQVERYVARFAGFARTAYDRLFVDIGHVDAAEAAAAAGCDAILLDTFADYGIDAMRAAVPVPAIGAGEAAIAAAAKRGSFSIVTVWPESMAYIYDERLRASAGGERCVKVHHFSPEWELAKLGTDAGVVQRMIRGEDSVVERLTEACRVARAEDGVDCIVLGCTCMAPVGLEIDARSDFPVIEAARAGLAAAFAALEASPAPRGALSPHRGTLPLLVDAWLEHGPVPAAADACEVCVTVSEADLAARAG